MSFLVLHMDKFKKEAIRGIQSHNLRERRSHSNPDIEYGRSAGNYELHDGASGEYAQAVQNRIDDLLLVKAVRKDAVHMCGVIVSSDSEFFKKLSPESTRIFFENCKEFLTKFVGKENVIAATVHMDEKTPHMHFLHVPVTKDGRLNANSIYTRESLKNLQTELPQYLRDRGFVMQRGIEQEPGSEKKHLDTREFKQQQNALDSLKKDVRAVSAKLKKAEQQESELRERALSYEQQAQEADKILETQHSLPDASVFNFKSVLEQARHIIDQQKKALAGRVHLEKHNERLQEEVREEKEKNARREAAHAVEMQQSHAAMKKWMDAYNKALARLEDIEKFFRWNPKANTMHMEYVQEQRQEEARKASEQRAHEREERQREERERQVQEQKAQEQERRREEERRLEHEAYRARRGMGMGR